MLLRNGNNSPTLQMFTGKQRYKKRMLSNVES